MSADGLDSAPPEDVDEESIVRTIPPDQLLAAATLQLAGNVSRVSGQIEGQRVATESLRVAIEAAAKLNDERHRQMTSALGDLRMAIERQIAAQAEPWPLTRALLQLSPRAQAVAVGGVVLAGALAFGGVDLVRDLARAWAGSAVTVDLGGVDAEP